MQSTSLVTNICLRAESHVIILIFVNGRAFSVIRMKGSFTDAFVKLLSSVAKYAPGSYYFSPF